MRVSIKGYTDSTGGDKHNMTLSGKRANSVRDYLISKGVAADRLVAQGFGKADPIGDNTTQEGRAKNRRVELDQM